MAKRFTDTDKYKKQFFRNLPGAYKLFWDYLYHDCNHLGIWHKDFAVAQIYLGQDMIINEEEALALFNRDEERVVVINGGSKWFIKPFVDFQYGPLKDSNRLHQSVISGLEKEGLRDGTTSPLQGAKDKDKEKEDVSLKGGVGGEKLTDVQKVVTVFKLCQGVAKDDKAWDKVYFARFSRPAKELIELLGDWKTAGDCVQETYEKMTSKGLTCTLETVIKHATEWRKDLREKEARRGVLSV